MAEIVSFFGMSSCLISNWCGIDASVGSQVSLLGSIWKVFHYPFGYQNIAPFERNEESNVFQRKMV